MTRWRERLDRRELGVALDSRFAVDAWIEGEHGNDGVLVWEYRDPLEAEGSDLPASKNEGALRAFLRLERASSAQDFADFASVFGPLELCSCRALPIRYFLEEGVGCKCVQPSHHEPLLIWRAYVFMVAAMRRIARALHRGREGSDRDWSAVHAAEGFFYAADYSTDGTATFRGPITVEGIQELRRQGDFSWRGHEVLARAVTRMLRLCHFMPGFDWEHGERPRFELVGSTESVLSVIARQLVTSIMYNPERRLDAVQCTNCGDWFEPTRRPRAGELSWCHKSECKYAARAHAQHRHYHGLTKKRRKS
jgi:hypothetical protein